MSLRQRAKDLVAGMRLSRRLTQTVALRPFVVEELQPGLGIKTDAALLDHARQPATTIYRPVGTCRMGIDLLAVVDRRLRLVNQQPPYSGSSAWRPDLPTPSTSALPSANSSRSRWPGTTLAALVTGRSAPSVTSA